MLENAQVTFALFAWVVGGLSGIFSVILWFVIGRMVKLRDDFSDYKLIAVDKFASVTHLQEVEGRLTDEIKGLRGDIKELTTAMNLLAGLSGVKGNRS